MRVRPPYGYGTLLLSRRSISGKVEDLQWLIRPRAETIELRQYLDWNRELMRQLFKDLFTKHLCSQKPGRKRRGPGSLVARQKLLEWRPRFLPGKARIVDERRIPIEVVPVQDRAPRGGDSSKCVGKVA